MTVEKLLEGCEHDGSYIPVGEVKRLMKEYARIKCLEAIENTKIKICEELESLVWPFSCDDKILNYPPIQLIQNIPNKEVMPEL